MQPFVSIVTPTYNRRKFIPTLIELYKNQKYPKDRMEWLILDDGTDKVEDLFVEASKKIPNIRYIYNEEKLSIGKKRNLLNQYAKGDIIIALDDDDYYPENRVSTVVHLFGRHKNIDLAGSSEMLLFYTDNKKIYSLGPFNDNHATNGTMAWRKSYAKKHLYNETVTHAEERSFLEEYKYPMIQIDSKKTILVICHNSNTFDKYQLRDGAKHTLFKETNYKLRDIVKEQKIRDFYNSF
jgi:glycosyltransferase involved in cell wall biosynthesis